MTAETKSLLQEEAERTRRASAWLVPRALLRDPVTLIALTIFTLILLSAVAAELLAPHDPLEQDLRMRNMPPFSPAAQEGAPRHILGTDPLGRDMLSRIIFGARVSLTVGLSSALVSGVIGTMLGIIAGYYRGKADDIIMRLVDIQMSIPVIMLALLVLFSLGPGFWNLVVVLAIVRWMAYARLARGQTLAYRNSPFIDAGRQYIASAWWIVAFPGLTIFLTTLSLNLLASSLRAISDPVQRERWLNKGSGPANSSG
ncbi:MAG: ABC transporter permease [Caldilineaceae bacterium]|nr:ABC transporter permease [Caldilineaceae bacterium]